MLKRVLTLGIFLFFVSGNYVSAASFAGGSYDSSDDAFYVKIDGTGATQLLVQGYMSSSSSNPFYSASYKPQASGTMTINCNGYYKLFLKNDAGSTLSDASFNISQIKNERSACKEDKDNFKEPSSPSDGGSGGSSGDCSTAVCQCIAQLEGVNKGISSKIDDAISNQGKMNDAIKQVNQSVQGVNDSVGDLIDQFKTNKSYDDFPKTPDYDLSDKPDLPKKAFEDNTSYFKDKGDVPLEIPRLPDAPEPADWDGVKREDPLKKEKELKKDKELTPDEEMKKDKFKQDKELTPDEEMKKDKFKQDKELKPDEEMKKDKFKQDKELTPDEEMKKDKFKQDKELTPDEEMKKDKFKQDKELTPDREMEKDKQMKPDKEMKADEEMTPDKFKQDKELTPDDELEQQDWYKRDKEFEYDDTHYKLRWKQ